MQTWAQQLLQFYNGLSPVAQLPNNIGWLYPQASEDVMKLVNIYLEKYYNDVETRKIIFGINPGRFGAGVTGINFTAPKQLAEHCEIPHDLKMQSELSAEFIYRVIEAYGGPKKFYRQFFISSVCPLGFVQNGKNINYYDDKKLLATVEPFIIDAIQQQLQLPVEKDFCLVIGGEKNYKFFSRLNERFRWFRGIKPLPHPRFIMQYRRKYVDEFVDLYLKALTSE